MNIAKYRHPGIDGKWFLTDFTMDQVEKYIIQLEQKIAAYTTCRRCDGTGRRLRHYWARGTIPCEFCGGTGKCKV